jgi:Uma2 family endonuclease
MFAHIPIVATDEDIIRIAEKNPGWHVERESDGSVVMAPFGAIGGPRIMVVLEELIRWNSECRGGIVFPPETGFTMPDTALRVPDASWIAHERWNALSKAQRDSFAPIVPDVIVEITSKSDDVRRTRVKAQRDIEYGARYVVVIDPYGREAFELGERPEGLVFDYEAIYAIE